MGKAVYIAEKPSVAQEFAKALKLNAKRKDGYLESEEAIVTWCVGHLVTMSYPEVYDPALKKWSLNTLPFLPQEFQYEVIPGVAKQFQIVSSHVVKPQGECNRAALNKTPFRVIAAVAVHVCRVQKIQHFLDLVFRHVIKAKKRPV